MGYALVSIAANYRISAVAKHVHACGRVGGGGRRPLGHGQLLLTRKRQKLRGAGEAKVQYVIAPKSRCK